MTDHFPRPSARASAAARVTELHQLAREDYAKGTSQRLSHRLDAYLAADTTPAPAAAPSDLDVAISVAQQLLDSDQVLSLREALRLLLRAIGAESAVQS